MASTSLIPSTFSTSLWPGVATPPPLAVPTTFSHHDAPVVMIHGEPLHLGSDEYMSALANLGAEYGLTVRPTPTPTTLSTAARATQAATAPEARGLTDGEEGLRELGLGDGKPPEYPRKGRHGRVLPLRYLGVDELGIPIPNPEYGVKHKVKEQDKEKGQGDADGKVDGKGKGLLSGLLAANGG